MVSSDVLCDVWMETEKCTFWLWELSFWMLCESRLKMKDTRGTQEHIDVKVTLCSFDFAV